MRSVDETTEILRLDQVTKMYAVGKPNALEVLHGISLTLNRGEFVALIGPSGSGKSTLLNIIGLLDRPTSGTLYLAGKDTSRMKDAELTEMRSERIGFVFQQSYLLSAFSAIENVMMPMLLQHEFPSDPMRVRAHDLLVEVGLDAWEDNPATNLSGGQQQRVAIARALAMTPALILADEPTGNLDSKSGDEIAELLKLASSEWNRAIVMVTHDMRIASHAGRIVFMRDGKIVNDVKMPAEGGAEAARAAMEEAGLL
jgi:lipoprotein-releasing system ATP-binding protein